METASSVESRNTRKYSIVDRAKQAEAIREIVQNKRTQREVAEEYGMPRSTVQSWVKRVDDPKSGVDPKGVLFYESPEGLAHLHGILMGAYIVFHGAGGCGLPSLQKFLELSRLSAFVGSSMGTLHNVSTQLNQQLIEFRKQECSRMAEGMSLKEMTAARRGRSKWHYKVHPRTFRCSQVTRFIPCSTRYQTRTNECAGSKSAASRKSSL